MEKIIIGVKAVQASHDVLVGLGRQYVVTLDCGHSRITPSLSWRDDVPMEGGIVPSCSKCAAENLRPEIANIRSTRMWGSLSRIISASGLSNDEAYASEAVARMVARRTD